MVPAHVVLKKRGGWRDFVGMATALNIVFHQSGDTLTVEIGAGKWLDMAAVGAVGMFIFAPFVIPAGFGAWEQMKLPEKIFDYTRNRLVVVRNKRGKHLGSDIERGVVLCLYRGFSSVENSFFGSPLWRVIKLKISVALQTTYITYILDVEEWVYGQRYIITCNKPEPYNV